MRQERAERVAFHARALEVCARLGLGLPLHERLGLGEEVGKQQSVVLADGVVGLDGGEKIARHELRPLVQQLIEGVLAVGARLAPDHGAGLVVDDFPVAGYALAVRLHVALLEVRGEAGQVLVVRQDGVGFGAEEVVVPDAQQRQRDRQILSSGALRKCSSISCAPSSRARKLSKPMPSAMDSPIDDHSE